MRRVKTTIFYGDYRVTATVVFGDYEGDPDVAAGTTMLEPYVLDDFTAIETTGREYDATEDIDDGMREDMEAALIDRAAEEHEI